MSFLIFSGTFLLTHLLLDKIKSSSPSRIINTSALAYQLAVPDFNDIKFEKTEYKGGAAYALSKLALMLFTKQLAKELEGIYLFESAYILAYPPKSVPSHYLWHLMRNIQHFICYTT